MEAHLSSCFNGNILLFFTMMTILRFGAAVPTCPAGCHVMCRGAGSAAAANSDSSLDSSSPNPNPNRAFCYCRCRPPTIDYGTLIYAAVIEDTWQIRCGYLEHPFAATALAMNRSGLLDEFAVTRCQSDYADECRSTGEPGEVCRHEWAAALCRRTCADYEFSTSAAASVAAEEDTTSSDSTTAAATTRDGLDQLCPPDIYFRKQRPSIGNPYTGCADLQMECSGLYDRGYCQLRPSTINCQETCGRCIGDDAYMPWNPIRSQLIQWALNHPDDGTAKALIDYFLRQYADYVEEVHRSCAVGSGTSTTEEVEV